MTIHKAKGLGFDLVILCDLEGNRLDQRRDGLAVQKTADRSIEWILELPQKLLYDADNVLADHARMAEAEVCYEQLSLLYVAMTRARRAMYLIIEPPRKSTSSNFPRLLTETLGEHPAIIGLGGTTLSGSYSYGEARWHLAGRESPRSERPGKAIECISLTDRGRYRSLAARRPSEKRLGRVPGAALFSPKGGRSADFGAAVHSMFASIEWWNPGESAAWVADWRERPADEAALEECLACLGDPQLSWIFARPTGIAEVWRERAFESVVDGVWITGVFDRVVIQRDAAGKCPSSVSVFDFKSDRVQEPDEVAGAVERHRDQIGFYRRVAAVLAGVSPARIDCRLVFTACRRAVPVPPGS
jgi:ATP-dependent exoDNAse (exonuclease V) beta subunit